MGGYVNADVCSVLGPITGGRSLSPPDEGNKCAKFVDRFQRCFNNSAVFNGFSFSMFQGELVCEGEGCDFLSCGCSNERGPHDSLGVFSFTLHIFKE